MRFLLALVLALAVTPALAHDGFGGGYHGGRARYGGYGFHSGYHGGYNGWDYRTGRGWIAPNPFIYYYVPPRPVPLPSYIYLESGGKKILIVY